MTDTQDLTTVLRTLALRADDGHAYVASRAAERIEALEAEVRELREDLSDARSGWESAVAEVRERDAARAALDPHIALLRRFNRWRRGDEDEAMPHPREIGVAIDAVCAELAPLEGGD